MAAILQINQAGIDPGEPGVAREDGLDTGALVTLISTAHESTYEFALLWVGLHPAPDTTSVATLQAAGAGRMSFSPTPGVYGSWRVELVTDRGTAKEDRDEVIFAIKQSPTAIRIPAANERADPSASLVNSGPAYVARSSFNAPDGISGSPFENGTYVSWWRCIADLIYLINDGGGGGGGGGPPGIVAVANFFGSGSNNNIAPSPNISQASALMLTVEMDCAFTGLVPPTNTELQYHLSCVNFGPGDLTFKHNSSSSTSGQRFHTTTAGDVVVPAYSRFSLLWLPQGPVVGEVGTPCWALYTAAASGGGGSAGIAPQAARFHLVSGGNFDIAPTPSIDQCDALTFTVVAGASLSGILAPSDPTKMKFIMLLNDSDFAITVYHQDTDNVHAESQLYIPGGADHTMQPYEARSMVWMPGSLSRTGTSRWFMFGGSY